MVYSIAVIGLGGVGGYFGFKLAETYGTASDIQINFVATNETYDRIRKNGLVLLSPEHENTAVHPDNIYNNAAHLPVPDLLLICVKAYDLEAVCTSIKDIVGPGTVVLPLMNGVDICQRIRKVIQNGVVLPACVYVASHIKQKGCVVHNGKPGRIILGKDPVHQDVAPDKTIAVLKNAGINAVYKAAVYQDIWEKFLFITSFGLVTARYNKTIGEVNADAVLKATTRAIMKEVAAVARYAGIVLTDENIERAFETAAAFPYHTPTSLQLDVHSGKNKNELELFAGPVIAYAEQVDADVHITEAMYAAIKQLLKSVTNG